MKMNKKVKILLIKNVSIFLLYFLLYLALPNLYFEMPRIRLASVLSLIVLFDISYIYGVSLGILVVNLFSPLGVWDYIVSTLVSIGVLIVSAKYIFLKHKNSVFISSLVIVLGSISSVIAMMINYIEDFDIFSKLLHILSGDFLVLSLFGSLLFYSIRDKKLFKLITKQVD